MTAQVVMSLLFVYAGRTKKETVTSAEQAAFLPASLRGLQNMNDRPYHTYRWSGDSGQGTEPPSARESRDISPSDSNRDYCPNKPEAESDDEEDEPGYPHSSPSNRFRFNVLDKFLGSRVPKMESSKILKMMELTYEVVDRTILILGFIALTTGVVTYSGIFVGGIIFQRGWI